nr:prolipoprotein diacylglyceryl transferase [Clostridia bacterium]
MKKALLLLAALLALACIAALPFLCAHSDLLPEVSTAYYEQKAQNEALTATGPEAELMRLLLGSAAVPAAAPEPTRPAFSAFGLTLAIGAAFAIALLLILNRKLPGLRPALLWTAALAVPMGLIGARLVYCAVNVAFYLKDISAPEAMLRIWEGGLSLAGALIFIGLAGVIGARLGKAPVAQVLHAAVPAMYALIFTAAAGCIVIGTGYGPELPESFFTVSIDGVARLDTAWLLIVAVSVLMIIATLCMQKAHLPAGRRFALYAFLYGSMMILLESLRRDGHMVWGFVHAEMALDLCFALPALLYLSGTKKRILLSLLATAALSGAVIALEFALDRSNLGDGLLYAVYAVLLGGYICLGSRFALRKAE